MKLLSIPEEAAACRKAWAGKPIGTLAVHCHHCVECEPLTEPAENRIGYILREKAESERALRLRLFRPALLLPPELAAAWAKWAAARAKWEAAWAELDAAQAELDAAWAELEAAQTKVDAARAKRDAAWAKWKAAWAKWEAAWAEWVAAWAQAVLPHATFCAEPDCPWNGRTIFPSVESDD